eukprot:m.324228 g.324228  ORF g.324228 m.324228 type:complete len:51 (+) comp20371_c0_seq1:1130-1282(+)
MAVVKFSTAVSAPHKQCCYSMRIARFQRDYNMKDVLYGRHTALLRTIYSA